MRQRGATMLLTAFASVALMVVIALLAVPYAIYAPGPATNVLGDVGDSPLIRIDGTASYRPTTGGTLDMTTVSVFGGPGRSVSLAALLQAWVEPSRAVLPVEQVFPPGQTQEQSQEETAAEMSQSQQDATAAGLRELGKAVTEQVELTEVSAQHPAGKVLRAKDVLLRYDGVKVTSQDRFRSLVAAGRPGQTVHLQVRRDGATRDVTTTLDDEDGRTVLGVGLVAHYVFPVDVGFATRDVGGPSAGMMFALGIYDLLTPGDLTGGQRIAGTGTIDGTGTVGPIGGIAQKLVGARNAGARWFLAPADNCDEVVGHVPDGLRVVRTASLHESRLDVERIAAGDAADLPTCTR